MAKALLRIHLTSSGQSLVGSYRGEGIQGGIVLLDSVQARLRELHRRNGPASKEVRRFLQRQAGQILRCCKAWTQKLHEG